ncbi:MAG: hypothetical protein K6F50_04070, partial [Kiritimatiellae bacterium]|nr:hypothetical protein [Kiritimatiellia bacterium]
HARVQKFRGRLHRRIQRQEFGSNPLKKQCPRIICTDCPVRFCRAVHLVAKAGIEPATHGFSVFVDDMPKMRSNPFIYWAKRISLFWANIIFCIIGGLPLAIVAPI